MVSDEFHMEGKPYNRDGLIQFCRKAVNESSLPEWQREVYEFILLFLEEKRGPIIQKTSGTTGDPKRIVLERGKMIRSAGKTNSFFGLRPRARCLLCLPVRYIAGKMMVVRALVGGLDLVLTEPSGRPLRSLRERISFSAMVPLQLHETLSRGDNLDLIDTLLIGGGELQTAERILVEGLTRTVVYESFAMTETYTHFALKRISGKQPENRFRLLEGVTVRQDQRGCLVVGIEGVTEGEVVTNDLVELMDQGDGFRWLGRADHVINTGGIKIIPEVVEEKITKWVGHPCLLLSQPDERLGEKLVLVVEYKGSEPPLEKWWSSIRGGLSPFEVPKRIVVTIELPRNEAMKPDRKAARALC